MARPNDEREPGRIRTMVRIFHMTRKQDRLLIPLMVGAVVLPIAIALALAFILAPGDVLFTIIWSVTGLLVALMLVMMTLTWRAEKLAFSQIEGKPGAVGAVLSNIRGSWRSSEMPVAVNTKTQDAVYRAIGRCGIVLIAEGPKERTQRLVVEEQRKVKRIVPNVPIHHVQIGPDSDVPLRRLMRRLRSFKRTLTRAEVVAVSNRLSSLGGLQMPIPKGMDPRRVRAGRPR